MLYNSENNGGIGYVIKFPEDMLEEDISGFAGIYVESNIERLELEGIIQGMEALIKYIKKGGKSLSAVSKIIVITDRFALQDNERTSPFRIRDYRKNKGMNHEGKEIKNWDLLNKLDKTRTKLSALARRNVRIEYRRRKENKEADKLSKQARKEGVKSRKIALEGHKIGKRKFDGQEVVYKTLEVGETISVNIFRKQFLKVQCEVSAELVDGPKKGQCLKIYTDFELQERLQRGNAYDVRIKHVFNHHIVIFRTIEKRKK